MYQQANIYTEKRKNNEVRAYNGADGQERQSVITCMKGEGKKTDYVQKRSTQ